MGPLYSWPPVPVIRNQINATRETVSRTHLNAARSHCDLVPFGCCGCSFSARAPVNLYRWALLINYN